MTAKKGEDETNKSAVKLQVALCWEYLSENSVKRLEKNLESKSIMFVKRITILVST
ncbi:hypothetical protein V7457_20365 [Bacillus toyonensis]|uniref:hypothetical protein n=1 Tax=Bacillus toyonensis TaxID=155322 RepID=UPI002FFE72D6